MLKKSPSRIPSDETILASDCKTHRKVEGKINIFPSKDGICFARDCYYPAVAGNIEGYLGDGKTSKFFWCRLYERLLQT